MMHVQRTPCVQVDQKEEKCSICVLVSSEESHKLGMCFNALTQYD